MLGISCGLVICRTARCKTKFTTNRTTAVWA